MIEEFLDEAASLSLEDKMDMWHNGTRSFNVPACGEPKLIDAHKICIKKGYTQEASILAAEANKRGIQLGQQAAKQQPDYKTNFLNLPNNLTEADFTKDDLKAIRDNDQDHIFIRSSGINGLLKEVLIKLIYAMLLKQKEIVTQIKDKICQITGISEGELKNVVTKIISDKTILNKITDNVNSIDESLKEDIEKHNTLNPKLWNEDNTLKIEVADKIKAIINEFVNGLKEDGIKFNIKDIVLVGSNCSYNYTKDSDLDIHVIADTTTLNCPDNLYPALYGAYRSIFNNKFDIDFYDIPVEFYVETEDTTRVSNGCYSVLNNMWVKEPVAEDIPEIDKEAFDAEFDKWEKAYEELLGKAEDKLDEDISKKIKISNNENLTKDEKELDPPISLDYFPNNMGINLCSVEKEEWTEQDDGQLKDVKITFIPENEKKESLTEDLIMYNDMHDLENIFKLYQEATDTVSKNTLRKAVVLALFQLEKYWPNYKFGHQKGTPEEQQRWQEISDICWKQTNTTESMTESKDEEILKARSIIADQIRGEWDADKGYTKAAADLAELKDIDTEEAQNMMLDIASEEHIHAGELETAYDAFDPKLFDELEDGHNEANEKAELENKPSYNQDDTEFNESLAESVEANQIEKIEKFINDLYELRKISIATDGEYGIGNLVFKEMRNKGYLDTLKDIKNKLKSQELSLHK